MAEEFNEIFDSDELDEWDLTLEDEWDLTPDFGGDDDADD